MPKQLKKTKGTKGEERREDREPTASSASQESSDSFVGFTEVEAKRPRRDAVKVPTSVAMDGAEPASETFEDRVLTMLEELIASQSATRLEMTNTAKSLSSRISLLEQTVKAQSRSQVAALEGTVRGKGAGRGTTFPPVTRTVGDAFDRGSGRASVPEGKSRGPLGRGTQVGKPVEEERCYDPTSPQGSDVEVEGAMDDAPIEGEQEVGDEESEMDQGEDIEWQT